MTPESLRVFMVAHGYDNTSLGLRIGTWRNTIAGYLAGKQEIPLMFRLALAALEHDLKPME